MILILLCGGEGRRAQQRRRRLRKRHLKSEFAHASLLIALIASSSIDLFSDTAAILTRFKEYYRMPRGHELISFVFFERFSEHFFLKFS